MARLWRRTLVALVLVFGGHAGAASAASVLNGGESLTANTHLTSPNGKFELWEGADGNTVLYDVSVATSWKARWSTGAAGVGAKAYMQRDGNFVTYDANMVAKWSSGTAGFSGGTATLQLQNDGNLVIYRDGLAVWNIGGFLGDTLPTGAAMKVGAIRRSRNGRYQLQFQTDGNLALYDTSTTPWTATWSSGSTSSGTSVTMQTDGNLVTYGATGPAQWASGTGGFSGADLRVQDDGNLTIVRDDLPVWTMGKYVGDQVMTSGVLKTNAIRRSRDGHYQLQMQGDGVLVVYDTSTTPWSARWSSGTSGANLRVQNNTDGQIVMYDPSNNVKWSTGTPGHPGDRLELQNNSHLTVMEGDTALWVDYRTSWQYGSDANSNDGSVDTDAEADRVIDAMRAGNDANGSGLFNALSPGDQTNVRNRANVRFWSSANYGGGNFRIDTDAEVQRFVTDFNTTDDATAIKMDAGIADPDRGPINQKLASALVDGGLYRPVGSPKVYLFENQLKSWITSTQAASDWDYDLSTVARTNQGALDLVNDSDPATIDEVTASAADAPTSDDVATVAEGDDPDLATPLGLKTERTYKCNKSGSVRNAPKALTIGWCVSKTKESGDWPAPSNMKQGYMTVTTARSTTGMRNGWFSGNLTYCGRMQTDVVLGNNPKGSDGWGHNCGTRGRNENEFASLVADADCANDEQIVGDSNPYGKSDCRAGGWDMTQSPNDPDHKLRPGQYSWTTSDCPRYLNVDPRSSSKLGYDPVLDAAESKKQKKFVQEVIPSGQRFLWRYLTKNKLWVMAQYVHGSHNWTFIPASCAPQPPTIQWMTKDPKNRPYAQDVQLQVVRPAQARPSRIRR